MVAQKKKLHIVSICTVIKYVYSEKGSSGDHSCQLGKKRPYNINLVSRAFSLV